MIPSVWIVGLDLSPGSHGAMHFARWLHHHARGTSPSLVGLHVVEQTILSRTQYPGEGSLEQRARALAEASVGSHPVRDAIGHVDVVEAGDASQALGDRAADRGDAGIIVGRARGSNEWSLVSLGRTARRLLRHAPGPLWIVPPDLGAHGVGPGPIVIALSATPDCVAAFRFAQALGARYDRPLLAVNVSAPPNVIGTSPEAGIAWEPFPLSQSQLDELEQSHSESLRQWCAEHDLQLPPRLHMGYGPPATVIEQVAVRHDACMIVCGTRQLGLGQRIFNSSTATDLAAHSARPVLVVPTPSP